MGDPVTTAAIISGAGALGGGALAGSGGKKGGGGGDEYLNKMMQTQYDTTQKFKPMTTEWSRMGSDYMGVPRIGAIEDWAKQTGFGNIGASAAPRGTPKELEDMPALRDILYTPGGTNELLMRRQGEIARDQITGTLPQGGVMQSELANQRRGENENLGALRVDARRNAANMVLGGGPMIGPWSQLAGGATQTAGVQAQQSMAQSQLNAGGKGGMGQLLGQGMGKIPGMGSKGSSTTGASGGGLGPQGWVQPGG